MIALLNALLPRGWRFERRSDYSSTRAFAFHLIAVSLALAITALFIWAGGKSPLETAKHVIGATLATPYGREQLLVVATPLILCAAAFVPASRMGLFNLGIEGQLIIGAFAAAAIGLHVRTPNPVLLPLMFLAGIVAGGLYAFIPGLLRAKAGVSEILITLLLNPLAIQWAAFIGMRAWADRSQGGLGANSTAPMPVALLTFGNSGLHVGIIVAVLVVVALWFALSNTVWGYEVTSIGAGHARAEFAGMRVFKHMALVMVLSGAIAGLAGVIQLTGVDGRFSSRISAGLGFMGINVAILAGESTLALIPWGLFMALVANSGNALRTAGLSPSLPNAITGLILILASVGEVLAGYRLARDGGERAQLCPADDMQKAGVE